MPINEWDAALYQQKHSFVFEYGRNLVELLDPRPGERVLDLGCGTGQLTKDIADKGATAIGLDGSPDMVESARRAYPAIEFVVADARDFSFPESFDAVFSNATLHWIAEPKRAARSIANALKVGGRLVAEFGGKNNVGQILTSFERALKQFANVGDDQRNYFPSIGEYTPILEDQGLEVTRAELFDRPTELADGERGLRNWLEMFRRKAFTNSDEEIKEKVIRAVEDDLRASLFQGGRWFADYRRIRIVARKI